MYLFQRGSLQKEMYPFHIREEYRETFIKCPTNREGYDRANTPSLPKSETPAFNYSIALALKASKSNVLLINKVCL